MDLERILDIIEANPTLLVLVTLPFTLVILYKMVGLLLSSNKTDSKQVDLQTTLVNLASKSWETNERLRRGYDRNVVVQNKQMELIAKMGEILDRTHKDIVALDQKIDIIATPITAALDTIQESLLKKSTTKVVVRSEGKIVSTFVAKPHKLSSGEEVLLVDIVSIKK